MKRAREDIITTASSTGTLWQPLPSELSDGRGEATPAGVNADSRPTRDSEQAGSQKRRRTNHGSSDADVRTGRRGIDLLCSTASTLLNTAAEAVVVSVNVIEQVCKIIDRASCDMAAVLYGAGNRSLPYLVRARR